MAISRFYYNRDYKHDPDSGNVNVLAMGIHEKMKPGFIVHGGTSYQYFLLMFFHDQAWVRTDSRQEDAMGNFIIWEPGALHNYGNPTHSWDHSWLVIEGEPIRSSLTRNCFPVNELLSFKSEKIFIHYLKILYQELQKDPGQDNYMLNGIFQLMLYELSRIMRYDIKLIPENISAAEIFIQKNFSKNLELADIAAVASLSISRFSVIFKQYYKEAPVQYLINTRLRRAAQLLQYKQIPIKQIAIETGFSDQLYFSRKFADYFKCSPKEFRKRL